MVHEGYAAVSYRVLATRAGVTPALVQYYFPALDELFTAVVRRRTEESLERLAKAIEAGQPLRALWEYASDKAGARLTAELMALANHRKKIRAELGHGGERIRELVLAALSGTAGYPAMQEPVSPEVLVFLLTSTPRMIVMEESVGIAASHEETTGFMERYLDHLEPVPAANGADG
jgi:AcrR family transcriptional regulator